MASEPRQSGNNKLKKELKPLLKNKSETKRFALAIELVNTKWSQIQNKILKKKTINEEEKNEIIMTIAWWYIIKYKQKVNQNKPPSWCKSNQKFKSKQNQKIENFLKNNKETGRLLKAENWTVSLPNESTFYQSVTINNIWKTNLKFTQIKSIIKWKAFSIQSKKKQNDGKKVNMLESKLKWTTSKTYLVELIYAFQASGSINNGNATIKEIAETFEKMFNIQLGQYNRTFMEIKARKIEQTKFLNLLQQDLEKKIDNDYK
ncbi:MAG: RteC domain-containing protein [Flavobacteriales bacterium]|nr:RteC domain-containing protein [Flavobacteriales bacterium]